MLLTQQEGLLSYLIRNFCERLSVSYLKMEATLVVWDTLLFGNPNSNTMIDVLAIVLNLLSNEILGCANIADMVDIVMDKALDIHEYDFFLEIFKFYKERSLQRDGGELDDVKSSIPDMQSLLAKNLSGKVSGLID